MGSYSLTVKNKTYHFNDNGFGKSWVCPELNVTSSCNYRCIDAVIDALEKLEYDECIINVLKQSKDEKRNEKIADRHKSRKMSVQDAEDEYNKRAANHSKNRFLGFDVTIPIEYDEYDDSEEQRIRIAIKQHIGWYVSEDIWNHANYIERQHMCVKCFPDWGQVEPNWWMEYRNPDMIGHTLNLDKILDDIAIEMANEALEYYDYEEDDE